MTPTPKMTLRAKRNSSKDIEKHRVSQQFKGLIQESISSFGEKETVSILNSIGKDSSNLIASAIMEAKLTILKETLEKVIPEYQKMVIEELSTYSIVDIKQSIHEIIGNEITGIISSLLGFNNKWGTLEIENRSYSPLNDIIKQNITPIAKTLVTETIKSITKEDLNKLQKTTAAILKKEIKEKLVEATSDSLYSFAEIEAQKIMKRIVKEYVKESDVCKETICNS